MDRLAGLPVASARVASRCQSSRCRRTSVISAVSLGERAERRAGLDRLQLLGVADQHHLGAGFSACDSTRSIWRVPIMPASSITSTSRGPQQLAALPHDIRGWRSCATGCPNRPSSPPRSPTAPRRAPDSRRAPIASRATPSMADLPVPA
jgi:hypothetical protein